MRFACLGSGSKGNAWVVAEGKTCIMIDCGFGLRDTATRLARLGLEPADIDAILLTHEHSDHIKGAQRFSERHGCVAWMTHGCQLGMRAIDSQPDQCRLIDSGQAFSIGDLQVESFPVPHDAREPVQFRVSDGARHWALLTDAGHVTEHMVDMLSDCDAVAIECNHDAEMLRMGSYPAGLKQRILGRYGHLDNRAAATLLKRIAHGRLQHVVAAHLSEENNHPDLARQALADALTCSPDWIEVASQQDGLEWRSIV